jgi:hypothetical protein
MPAIPLPFGVPEDYQHIWMLFGKGKAVAFLGVNGRPELDAKLTLEADGMMSDVLDWQEEVIMGIRAECEAN